MHLKKKAKKFDLFIYLSNMGFWLHHGTIVEAIFVILMYL